MILHIYGFKNRKVGVFDGRISTELSEGKDFIEGLSLALSSADPAVLLRYQEMDVYELGILETKTGVIESHCDFVSSLEPICLSLMKGSEKDGRESE